LRAPIVKFSPENRDFPNRVAGLRELEETAYWLELLLEGDIASGDRLSAVYSECTELIAIFVTIVKRSREPKMTS